MGSGVGVSDLRTLGFDNITSSHTIWGSQILTLYDGYGYTNQMGETRNGFPFYFSDWDNKLSSLSLYS